jgi:hypothetical protein
MGSADDDLVGLERSSYLVDLKDDTIALWI